MRILVDTHAHTIASTHAYSTVHDYLIVAKERGLQGFTITDHGVAMPDSPHIYHFVNMKIFPRSVDGITIFRGMEANILDSNGRLDVPDALHDKLDLVIASFHEPVIKPTSKSDHTQALIGAIESGKCQIIGHPGNPNFPFDYQAVIEAAIQHNVAIEINNSSFLESRHGSEPNCMGILQVVKELGGLVSVGSDSHISYQLGEFSKSLEAIDKVGLASTQIINRDLASFKAFLALHNKSVVSQLP
ncbi:putative phosphatase [Neiella marina]|uniref:Putative phosphatase n=1 Tax=Neiella marina TaxID=508461 RepID=A0A8J2XQ45_9GAMM|nr:phosphatase [Neiella marina]GGA81586.1 putative phosphatase [Neiella marina]